MTTNFNIRLPEATKEKIDILAKVLGRPRDDVIAEAVERYVAEESRQIAEIQAGLTEDDAGLGITHDEVIRNAYAAIDE